MHNILAIDTGFSACKCKCGEIEFSFPSLVAPAKTAAINLGETRHAYRYGAQKLIVGHDAETSDDIKYVRDVKFLLEYGPVLVSHAIRELGSRLCKPDYVPGVIAVGLPLEHYREHRDDFRRVLGAYEIDGVAHTHADIRVFPQGVGALADYIVANQPTSDEDGYIVDIGFNTAIVLRYAGLKATSEGSNQYNQFGLSHAMDELGARIKNAHGVNLGSLQLNKVFLDGYFKHYGQRLDVSAMISECLSDYLDTLVKTIENEFDRFLQHSDRMSLVGGGAYYVKSHMPERYSRFCITPVRPEFANVRGYFFKAGGQS